MPRILGSIRFAAWLGVLALAINAYVPVHLARDLEAAIGTLAISPHGDVHAGHVAHHHHDGDGTSGDHHPSHPESHRECQVCSTVGAGGTTALAAVVEAPRFAAPVFCAGATPPDSELPAECPASYVSRAPPLTV